jgi:hypothetical protein
MAILGLFAAVAGFMWQMTKAKSAKAATKREKAARVTETKVTSAIIKGVEKENEIKNNNPTDRSSFLD